MLKIHVDQAINFWIQAV